jgi:hypothetical protein
MPSLQQGTAEEDHGDPCPLRALDPSPLPASSTTSDPVSFMDSLHKSLGFVPIASPPSFDKLYTGFLFPIEYLEKSQRQRIDDGVASDLELFQVTSSPSPSSTSSQREDMHTLFCQPSTPFGRMVLQDMCSQHTTNTAFLEETQTLIERNSAGPTAAPNGCGLDASMADRFLEVWREIKEDRAFLEKHHFMEYLALEELNRSRPFLHVYAAFNVVSPLLALFVPLFLLLLPFAVLHLKGVPISFAVYIDTLRQVAKEHFFGRLLSMRLDATSIAYTLVLAAMFCLQTYGQITMCIRYHRTVQRMNDNLVFLRNYLTATYDTMRSVCTKCDGLSYYADFREDLYSHAMVLRELRDEVLDAAPITPYRWSVGKVTELGHMFDCYYRLYKDMEFEECLRYSVGFWGYWDVLCGVSRGYHAGRFGKAVFVSEGATHADEASLSVNETENEREDTPEEDEDEAPNHRCRFVGQYHPAHGELHDVPAVTNTVDLSRGSIILTGINASGKTTTLKATALNVLFTQQFGVGCYESAQYTPFHHVHSYLNIPDTSARDSLFQAESRRCKHILDQVERYPSTDRHLCVFDELYSGTNPREATKTAAALLAYVAKRRNVRFLLTTHYVGVCDALEGTAAVQSFQMWAHKSASDDRFVYTYRMVEGVCRSEGGLEVLKQMQYPAEIIDVLERNEERSPLVSSPTMSPPP